MLTPINHNLGPKERGPACGKSPCGCNSPARVSFRRRHKGSGLTVIERLQMHPAGKEELLKKLKKRLGVGGTVKLGALELQGDHRDFVETELKSLGYKVNRLG